MLDLSVIIINHHHRGIIERCIESLTSLADPVTFELLVIDNTPVDCLGDWLSEHFPQIRLHTNAFPLGYAANAQIGFSMAVGGRYAMMLNPDVICLPGLLERLVTFMDGNPDVGVAGPRLLNEDFTLQPSCRAFPSPLTLGIRLLRLDGLLQGTSLMQDYLMANWDHTTPADVDWVTGAVTIVRREALATIPMDQDYFMYWEDLDFCVRLWRSGWRVCYVPAARAIHLHLRRGVKRPFSRNMVWQIEGAIKIFRKFGLRLDRTG